MSEAKVVSEMVVLPNPSQDPCGFYPADHLYHFTIAFPATCIQNQDPPPPTYSTWSPGMTCEVHYTLKVDVCRKGFRRHEESVYSLRSRVLS
jgi:hypothetical protein